MSNKIILVTKTNISTPRDGGSLRVSALVEELRRKNFDVVWFSAAETPGENLKSPRFTLKVLVANFRVLAAVLGVGSLTTARWYSPSLVRALVDARTRDTFSISIIEFSQLLIYRSILPGTLILDMHNIEFELMESYANSTSSPVKKMIAKYEAIRLRKLESRAPDLVATVAVVSEHDREILERISRSNSASASAKIVLAPNGVSADGFMMETAKINTVVFVAHLGWQPNVDAAVWLVTEVWPIVQKLDSSLRLQLVGRSPSPVISALASECVEVHADVATVLPYVLAAQVATAPLLASGGTRLKILEALSCGTPVVSTSLGALGLEHLDDSRGLTIADSPVSFAESVVKIAHSQSDTENIRALARAYLWPNAFARLVEELQDQEEVVGHVPEKK
ncbi:glycosyltransferase family 4 protein [Cryobacterium serini]|uniref:Glycosyltransferase n=1 Tax=Cryobacterium serini TaxID=1259201 RepID=A0A4R9BK01_9MICO|nr:glycosyltransferase family 4 protein [Cryobacterium serini]TFD86129.1 glycosyltransferase [Cryobacterium serini]